MPEESMYSQRDPIGIAGGNPSLYGYVWDSTKEVDIFGLMPETGLCNTRKTSEIFLDTADSHDIARNMLLDELDLTGAFTNGSNPYIRRLQSSYGYDKMIGRVSFDNKVRWRLDFDEFVGVHLNIEDFTNGKG